MTYTLRRLLPNATTCEVTWTDEEELSVSSLLDFMDVVECRIKERMNGPQAPNG